MAKAEHTDTHTTNTDDPETRRRPPAGNDAASAHDPRATDHPAGEAQAAANTDTEPAG